MTRTLNVVNGARGVFKVQGSFSLQPYPTTFDFLPPTLYIPYTLFLSPRLLLLPVYFQINHLYLLIITMPPKVTFTCEYKACRITAGVPHTKGRHKNSHKLRLNTRVRSVGNGIYERNDVTKRHLNKCTRQKPEGMTAEESLLPSYKFDTGSLHRSRGHSSGVPS
ncbi:hypothetical protein BDN72DRAFT_274690 [Pluteus cervinus]|uniref:Uncharacterized protein n=1 Tax=Pluteus cervinus TaxID=181527 RepID=A0ACD3AFJ7_9AGAR|nr:hypothetical protein BDN72DRAFT_274690 [Pluteus cervinus]